MGSALGVGSSEREVEVVAKAERRRFTVEYKRQVLEEAEQKGRLNGK